MGNRILRIYAQEITPRLEYTAEVLFSTILGIEYEITSDRRKLGNNPSIIYSSEDIRDQFVIQPAGLLSENGINKNVQPKVSYIEDMPVFFEADNGTIPFDIFSASFYMLSRYEEYLPFTPDAHGRYPGERSMAFRGGFLQIPVVEVWARYLAETLVRSFPVLTIRHNEFRSLVTFDVDQPFAYRSRGFLRSMGGLVKGIAGTGAKPAERIRTMTGSQPDPYDSFEYIDSQLTLHGAEALFFFPTGDQGDYDHNPPYRDHSYTEIIRKYDSIYSSGIHPSYKSAGRPKTLKMEAGRYRNITGHAAERARQHWLLLSMPETYQAFEDAGITHDYTMGYADEPGFRAGMARPFVFYDLSRDKKSGLTVVPFQVMDGTLRQYRHLTPDAAIPVIRSLISTTRKAGGLFVSVWHNTSLAEYNGWEGWRKVFEEMLALQEG
jgi:hypothetical protein